MNINRLEVLTTIQELIERKEKLKHDVMDPMLYWKERMELYQSIQGINERIRRLQDQLD